jgi:glycosyltransferase involved in cell wall biosynthesis
VTRDEVSRYYARADLYVLPTLSDGFAITQLEAMAHGLPVIATSHCGQVVSDNEDGIIIPARDVDAIVRAIIRIDRDRELLQSMSERALERSRQFTLARYAASIEDAMLERMHRRATSGPIQSYAAG